MPIAAPIPWLEILNGAIASEFTGKPAMAAFATATKKSDPRVRFVVCRKIESDGSSWFVSDHRSQKNSHLRVHPFAEAAFYFSTLRQQFRVCGKVEIIDDSAIDPRRKEAWIALTDASRALFRWPTPAAPFDITAEFTHGVPAVASIPETFELLILRPDETGHLDLNPHPHRRRRWRLANDWAEEELNP